MFYRSFLYLLLVSAVVNAEDVEISTDDDRIIGGTTANVTNFPYQLSIESSSGAPACAASIISPYWVLTSSYCVVLLGIGTSAVVRAGSNVAGSGGTTYQISSTHQHPSYGGPGLYDAGLIKVQTKIKFLSNVKAVKLTSTDTADGTAVTIAGLGNRTPFGSPAPNLQAVNMTLLSRSSCSTAYNNIPTVPETILCAGDATKNFCTGDFGGPLIDIAAKKQVGIASYIYKCALGGYAGIYTNVGAKIIRQWIKSTSGV